MKHHRTYSAQASPCRQAGYFWRIHRPGYCQRTSYRAGFFTLYALTVVTFIIEAAIFCVGLRGADRVSALSEGASIAICVRPRVAVVACLAGRVGGRCQRAYPGSTPGSRCRLRRTRFCLPCGRRMTCAVLRMVSGSTLTACTTDTHAGSIFETRRRRAISPLLYSRFAVLVCEIGILSAQPGPLLSPCPCSIT